MWLALFSQSLYSIYFIFLNFHLSLSIGNMYIFTLMLVSILLLCKKRCHWWWFQTSADSTGLCYTGGRCHYFWHTNVLIFKIYENTLQYFPAAVIKTSYIPDKIQLIVGIRWLRENIAHFFLFLRKPKFSLN